MPFLKTSHISTNLIRLESGFQFKKNLLSTWKLEGVITEKSCTFGLYSGFGGELNTKMRNI